MLQPLPLVCPFWVSFGTVLGQKRLLWGTKCAGLGGALPKQRTLCPQSSLFFGPKRPQNPLQSAKRREMVATLHVRRDLPVTNNPLLPSNSTICPRNGPIMADNGPDCGQFVSNSPRTKNGPYLGLRSSNPNSHGTYSTRNPPLFVVSKPQNHPTRA